MAILSLVGRQMRHMVGTAGKMFATLAEGNINIEMISQGLVDVCKYRSGMLIESLPIVQVKSTSAVVRFMPRTHPGFRLTYCSFSY